MNSKPSKSWVKGQSGNPNGRPRTPLSDALRKAVTKTLITKTGKKVTIQDVLAEAIVGAAMKGDIQAFNAIANRIEGMPMQPIEGKFEGSYTVNIDGLIGLSKASTQTTDGDPAALEAGD